MGTKTSCDEITFELITGGEEGIRQKGEKGIPRSYAHINKGLVDR